MLLVIDNYDSFTYNLVRYCRELGLEVLVRQNNQLSLQDIERLNPSAILLSPGPGTPDDAGLCLEVVQAFNGQVPILGVCLGHQVICQAFGGQVVRAKQVMHGKTSKLYHKDIALFGGLPQGYSIARYHSLVADLQTLPAELSIHAWTLNEYDCFDEIMAIKHVKHETYGVQFHPEALLTEHGFAILGAFFKAQDIDIQDVQLRTSELSSRSLI